MIGPYRRAISAHVLAATLALTSSCQPPRAQTDLVVGGVRIGVQIGDDVSAFTRAWPKAKFIDYVGWVQAFDPSVPFSDLIVPVDDGLPIPEPRRAIVRRIQLTVARASLSDSVATTLDAQWGYRVLLGCTEHPERAKRVRIWEWRSEHAAIFGERAEVRATADASSDRLLITVAGVGAQASSSLNPREELQIRPCSDFPPL